MISLQNMNVAKAFPTNQLSELYTGCSLIQESSHKNQITVSLTNIQTDILTFKITEFLHIAALYLDIIVFLSMCIQGSNSIRQWPINLFTTPMMIHKITPSKIAIIGWNVWTFNSINQSIKNQ